MQALSSYENAWLEADWPLQERFMAGTTLTHDPLAQYGFNLARHVNDNPSRVIAARERLLQMLPPHSILLWLSQIHSATVVFAEDYSAGQEGDALVSHDIARIPVIMTADCLPVLLANRTATVWAAVHAGWTGLYHGILKATIEAMNVATQDLCAWIGPCIRQDNYEIDAPFYQRFVMQDARYESVFCAKGHEHWLADLPAIARMQLQDAGLSTTSIADCGLCSFADKRFFSHRRDGKAAGRMASFIVPRY